MWLASFYLCIPVGYALGYIYGGIVGVALGWRPAFLIEALAMLPFVAVCFVVPPINIKGTHDGVRRTHCAETPACQRHVSVLHWSAHTPESFDFTSC